MLKPGTIFTYHGGSFPYIFMVVSCAHPRGTGDNEHQRSDQLSSSGEIHTGYGECTQNCLVLAEIE